MGNAKQISQNKDDIATVMWRDVNRATVVNKAIGTIKADITTNTACCAANKAATDTNKADIQNDAADIAANKVSIQASIQTQASVQAVNNYKQHVDIAKNKADIAANKVSIQASVQDVNNFIQASVQAANMNNVDIAKNKADTATNTANIAKEKTLGANNYYAIQCNRLWMSSSALTTIPNDAFDKASC